MLIYHTLDEVFRNWSHVAVLRTLIDTTNGFTGNEVARISGMHPRSALNALTLLETLGIVRRQRGGRDHIFTLNRNHWLVNELILPVYKAERDFQERIFSSLQKIVQRDVLSAIVFGSVALKQESPGSDLDLCCVVHSEKGKEPLRKKLHDAAPKLNSQFGIKLAPVFFTLQEFKKKSPTQLVKDILSYGMVIAGKTQKDLLRG